MPYKDYNPQPVTFKLSKSRKIAFTEAMARLGTDKPVETVDAALAFVNQTLSRQDQVSA